MKRFLFSASLLFMMAPSISSQVAVHVYYSQWEEYPLVKKIGLYQTPLVSKSWLDRDMPKLSELEARSMRYEMACGKDDLYGQPCVVGTADHPTYPDAGQEVLPCPRHLAWLHADHPPAPAYGMERIHGPTHKPEHLGRHQ